MNTVEQLRAELSAAKATIRGLQRQLALKIEAVSFAVSSAPSDFDEPTRRLGPAIVRREVRQ